MRRSLLALVFVTATACASNPPPPTVQPAAPVAARPAGEPPAEQIEVWEQHHEAAARALGEWVKTHPLAARAFFEWDGHHPERAHDFVTWCIVNNPAPIDGYIAGHAGWPEFVAITESHRPAANAFVAWTRRFPPAAEALMAHPRGLEWAGNHLYKSMWEMEH